MRKQVGAHIALRQRLGIQRRRTAFDGVKQACNIGAEQEKDRIVRRFLEHFEKSVLRACIHQLCMLDDIDALFQLVWRNVEPAFDFANQADRKLFFVFLFADDQHIRRKSAENFFAAVAFAAGQRVPVLAGKRSGNLHGKRHFSAAILACKNVGMRKATLPDFRGEAAL